MIELQEIIDSLNKIIQVTQDINSKYSIVKQNRGILKEDTKKLQEISEKLGTLSKDLDNTQLQIIADEIEYLKKAREELDNKKELSRTNRLTVNANGFVEGYSDRATQEANYELLKELSNQLDNINQSIQEKENRKNELEQKLEVIEGRDELRKEIEELGESLPVTVRVSILKELSERNLTPITIDNLDKATTLKEIQHQNRIQWEQLKNEKNNLENVLKISVITPEEKKQSEQRIDEINNQMKECQKTATLYIKITRKIERLEKLERELTEKDTKENIQRQIKEYDEEKIKEQERKQKREKEEEIKQSISLLPPELRIPLGIKLEENGLLTPIINEGITDERNISFNEETMNINSIEKLRQKLNEEETKSINDKEKLAKYTKIYDDLLIKENNDGLDNELRENKEKVKNYITDLKERTQTSNHNKKTYQRVIRNYSRTDKLINELIELTRTQEIEETQVQRPLLLTDDIIKEEVVANTPIQPETHVKEEFIPEENLEDPKEKSIKEGIERLSERGEAFSKSINELKSKITKNPMEQIASTILNENKKTEAGKKPTSTDVEKDASSSKNTETSEQGNPMEQIASTILNEKKETEAEKNSSSTDVQKDVSSTTNTETSEQGNPMEQIATTISNEKENKKEPEIEWVNLDEDDTDKKENKQHIVKRVRKSKNSIKKKLLKVITGLAIALVLIGTGYKKFHKKAVQQPITITNETNETNPEDVIQILSVGGVPVTEQTNDTPENTPQENLNNEDIETPNETTYPINELIDDYNTHITNTTNDELEYIDVVEPTQVTKEILENAIIQSGAMQDASNDEYTVATSQAEGITQENLPWWVDQMEMLHFVRDDNTGNYIAIEHQNSGEDVRMKWWSPENVVSYVSSIANQTNQDFNTLFTKLTGENYYNIAMTRGVRK